MKIILKITAVIVGLFILLLMWGAMVASPDDKNRVSPWQQAAMDSTKKFYGDGSPPIQPIRKDRKDIYHGLVITQEHFARPDYLFDFAFDYCLYFTIREKEQTCFLVFYKYNSEVSDESELGRPVAKFNYVPNTSYTESILIDKGKIYSTKDGSLDMYLYEKFPKKDRNPTP